MNGRPANTQCGASAYLQLAAQPHPVHPQTRRVNEARPSPPFLQNIRCTEAIPIQAVPGGSLISPLGGIAAICLKIPASRAACLPPLCERPPSLGAGSWPLDLGPASPHGLYVASSNKPDRGCASICP